MEEIKPLPCDPAGPADVPASRSAVLSDGCSHAPALRADAGHFELPATVSCFFISALRFPSATE